MIGNRLAARASIVGGCKRHAEPRTAAEVRGRGETRDEPGSRAAEGATFSTPEPMFWINPGPRGWVADNEPEAWAPHRTVSMPSMNRRNVTQGPRGAPIYRFIGAGGTRRAASGVSARTLYR